MHRLNAIVRLRLLSVMLFAGCADAQMAVSSINGTVTDPQGHPIPGAVVGAVEQSTGLARQTSTRAQGRYSLESLPAGVYTVTFSKAGFADFAAERVEQTVGYRRTLDARMKLSTHKEERVSIREPLVQINKNDATVGTPVEQAQVNELPLNGRNWASLTALIPGAIDNGASDQRTIRFAGHGLDDNNITLDGVDATAIYNQEQREYVRLAIPLGSIDEFRADSQNFGANVEGGTAGGQVAVVSRSGTNVLHGGAFEYFRNDALDARTPFDGVSADPFLLNQFGADLGGAIRPNTTFFYLNHEGLRQRLGQTQIGLVPSPSFIAQTELISPALAPIVVAYPHGTSATALPSVWNYHAEVNQIDNEDSGMVRFDEHFNERTTGFVRFNTDHAGDAIPTGSLNVLTEANTHFRNGIVDVLHVFTPTLLNEVKFGVNQEIYHTANLSAAPYTIAVSGFSSLAAGSTTDAAAKSFSLINDLSWVRGRHTLKLGLEIRWIQMNQGNSNTGTLTYDSPALFQLNQMDSASVTSLLPLKRMRKAQYWGYAQDDVRVSPNLTINLGVRYNFFNVFHEVDGRAIPFDLETCGGYCARSSSFTHPRHADFDPRVGAAWAHGNTVLRAGGGIYHSDGQEDDQNLPIFNDVPRYTLTAGGSHGLGYPVQPFLAVATGIVSPRDLYRDRKDMYVAAWTVSIQERLPGNVVGTLTYIGNKGTNLLTTTYENVVNPLTGSRPYPPFGVVSWRGNDSNSSFHAFQANARRAFESGFSLSANYMWSHSINDGGIGGGESDTVQDVFCRSCDKASSDYDVRQVFNTSIVYVLPFGAGQRFLSRPSVARALFGGWELSGIGTARTGLPVNVTIDRLSSTVPGGYSVSNSERPNLVPGVSLMPAGGQTPTDWINAAAFSVPASGTFGNAGRNLVRAPGLWQIDAAVAKRIALTERLGLQIRAEVFNVFNRAQYGSPQADLSSAQNFGAITTPVNQGATGSGTPRQIQLAARFVF